MKTLRLTLSALFLGLCTVSSLGQSNIKLHALSPALGLIKLSYEQKITPKSSAQLGLYLIRKNILGLYFTGFGAEGQYRLYLSKFELPKGLFIAPQLGLAKVNFNPGFSRESSYQLITFSALLGYQWPFKERFTFEIGIGPAYGLQLGDDFGKTDIFGDGLMPSGTMNVGYRIVR